MVYRLPYHHPNSQGGKISVTKSLLLLFLSSLFINLGREESGKQKEGWLGWSIKSSWWSIVTGPLPAHHQPITAQRKAFWRNIKTPTGLSDSSSVAHFFVRVLSSPGCQTASHFLLPSALIRDLCQQRRVAVKRILNYFCLTCWNNLCRKLSPGSVWSVLITRQFRVHLWFLVTDGADFQEGNLASVPWKVVLGKMDFRNEHNDDLIIDGNVRTQRAVASLFWGQTYFSFGKLPNSQQESKTQLISRGKMVWVGQEREQKLL